MFVYLLRKCCSNSGCGSTRLSPTRLSDGLYVTQIAEEIRLAIVVLIVLMEINGPVLFELALIASAARKTGVKGGFANEAIMLGWWLRSGTAGKYLVVVVSVCLHLIGLDLTEGRAVLRMLVVAIAVVGASGAIENMFFLVLSQEAVAWCWVLG